MSTNVRSYTDQNILDRIKQMPNFKEMPAGWFLVGVRSNEDEFNVTDDKFYLFNPDQKCVLVAKGTTNPGANGLASFSDYNKTGVAVMKSDWIHYNVWERRMHRGKVLAYCQRIKTKYYRDGDKDLKSEELIEEEGNIGLNFHPMTYIDGSKEEKRFINGWSLGCQTVAKRSVFDEIMRLTKNQKTLTYILLNEWQPE